jgi:hypothetical protein
MPLPTTCASRNVFRTDAPPRCPDEGRVMRTANLYGFGRRARARRARPRRRDRPCLGRGGRRSVRGFRQRVVRGRRPLARVAAAARGHRMAAPRDRCGVRPRRIGPSRERRGHHRWPPIPRRPPSASPANRERARSDSVRLSQTLIGCHKEEATGSTVGCQKMPGRPAGGSGCRHEPSGTSRQVPVLNLPRVVEHVPRAAPAFQTSKAALSNGPRYRDLRTRGSL